MTAYYNEIDPFAAAWLRELIKARLIADGIVDTRSIEDVRPDELTGFTQCHFFAGIGGWSLALRRAGWPDDRPIWTGSCPCQPFSTAGQGAGFADERHLWPSFFHLIEQCRPAVIAGEQVASKDADPWLDLVQDDLEAMGYAFGAVAFPSASVGAPHIRDRTYWRAYANGRKFDGLTVVRGIERNGQDAGRAQGGGQLESCGNVCRLGHTGSEGLAQCKCQRGIPCGTPGTDARQAALGTGICSCGLADSSDSSASESQLQRVGQQRLHPEGGCGAWHARDDERPKGTSVLVEHPGQTNGFWRDADWLLCRDGKWRPVEPGTFPLAHGVPARVGRLRGYGNAINAEQAALFVEVMAEAIASA